MNQLEQDYPNVTSIYMTGHLDGTGPSGNLYARNNQIRAYCTTNHKVLFDFADIESYDPDGNYYPDASDACEWCYTWCSSHPCPGCPDCAHSHCFNCYEKGKAWWWMMAKISGWNLQPDTLPNVVSTTPTQNQLNVPVNTNITARFDVDMMPSSINESTFVVNAWSTGLHQGTITYNSQTKVATLDPSENFDEGEIVTVVLTTGIKSSVGTPMESSYVWSFTTKVEDGAACFTPPFNYDAGWDPTSVFCADLDGDTDLDLAVPNYYSGNVSILKNFGNGIFQNPNNSTAGFGPTSLFCADLDGDGDLDLAVANSASDNVSILLNIRRGDCNGDGTFQTEVEYNVGNYPISVFCADLNGDTHLDLAVADYLSDSVSILINNGDGTFQIKVDYEVGFRPYSVFGADLDRDSDLDLAVAKGDGNISMLENNGNGTFATKVDYPVGPYPFSVFCADLDGDGDLDLAVANSGTDNVSILKNNGDGTFQDSINYGAGDEPRSVFCADLDGDLDLDLAVPNYYSGNVSILKNFGNGIFQNPNNSTAGFGPTSLFCADLDGDGDLDLAVANSASDNVSILLNIRRGDCNGDKLINVTDVVYLINYLFLVPPGPAPQPWAAGDVNCDGTINVTDVVYLINYLFLVPPGPPPGCP
jgi:hypothetical protein